VEMRTGLQVGGARRLEDRAPDLLHHGLASETGEGGVHTDGAAADVRIVDGGTCW
jgi:hypothetical protein